MKTTRALWAVLLGFAVGCGGEGSVGGLPIPVSTDPEPVSQVFQVPRAAAAADAVDLATQAATDVILDGFTGGDATDAPTPFLSPANFEFTSHVEFEIDLDSQGRKGNDRFPHASGLLLVTVDGSLQGTWLSGEASYSVLVAAGSDITITDPSDGPVTTIPGGSSWAFVLVVTWEITDSQNWIVIATATKAIDVQGLVVTDGDTTVTVSVVGAREVVSAIAKIDGEIVRERSIAGSFTITIDDGANTVEVILEFDNEGLILVTIGDEQFGPFTRQEFRDFLATIQA